MSDLVSHFDLSAGALGHLTSAVQLGFIFGTLVFALLTIADRYSPSRVFLVCALSGGFFNAAILLGDQGWWSLLALRFATGFCLAGIYPVGMKIAADYYEKGLGQALGFLVGALVLGTAFPHLLKSFAAHLSWPSVLLGSSLLALLGGLVIGLGVADGPFRKASKQFDFTAIFRIFKDLRFRSAAFGYFGHMWELYTFWAFLPTFIQTYQEGANTWNGSISLWSFLIIASGGLACAIGGWWSQRVGSVRPAFIALAISGLCCLISPWVFQWPPIAFLAFLLVWGMTVIADSPQFSTLVAQSAPADLKGSALTIVNSLGFAITIVSLQAFNALLAYIGPQWSYTLLLLGPVFGLLSMLPLLRRQPA